MKHLNLAPFCFAFKELRRKSGTVPIWSFFESMEWYGHNVGVFFTIPIPRSITPVRADPNDGDSPYVLPADSFNVVLPFAIVPAVYPQEGALIFGAARFGKQYFKVVHGKEHILASKANDFASNHEIVFAAVLKEAQEIAITLRYPESTSRVEVFSTEGRRTTTWREYSQVEARRKEWARRSDVGHHEARREIDEGHWRLV